MVGINYSFRRFVVLVLVVPRCRHSSSSFLVLVVLNLVVLVLVVLVLVVLVDVLVVLVVVVVNNNAAESMLWIKWCNGNTSRITVTVVQ